MRAFELQVTMLCRFASERILDSTYAVKYSEVKFEDRIYPV